jgi:hypothetical protein
MDGLAVKYHRISRELILDLVKFLQGIRRVSTCGVSIASSLVLLHFIALALPDQASQTEADSGDAGQQNLSLDYTADQLYMQANANSEG